MREASLLRLALERPVVLRASRYAVVVGAILIAINHADALLRGQIDGGRVPKMALTVLVPYLVSTFSSVAATRDLLCRQPAASETGDRRARRP